MAFELRRNRSDLAHCLGGRATAIVDRARMSLPGFVAVRLEIIGACSKLAAAMRQAAGRVAMADRAPAPDTPELRARWGAFAWTGGQRRQGEGDRRALSRRAAALGGDAAARSRPAPGRGRDQHARLAADPGDRVRRARARHAGDPRARGRDVLLRCTTSRPVGRFHVQVCGTTPCMLRGSDDISAAARRAG